MQFKDLLLQESYSDVRDRHLQLPLALFIWLESMHTFASLIKLLLSLLVIIIPGHCMVLKILSESEKQIYE